MSISAPWWSWSAHQRSLALALPMILSNVTTPLLGLVDTAVIGHLGEAYYLGGVAVGAMIITLIYWLLGFLRMATTGLIAQGYGEQSWPMQLRVLGQALLCAWLLALALVCFQGPLFSLALLLIGGSDEVQWHAQQYVQVRVWGAPAALANLVILGFLLGRHQSRRVMWLLILTNSINILFDLWFVVGLQWGVRGAAAATVLADYCAFFLGAYCCWQQIPAEYRHRRWLQWDGFSRLLALNRDIFIRSLSLQLCLAFVTAQGARMGDVVVAANSVLLHFTLVMAYALDGFAFAAEAQVGQALGAKNSRALRQAVLLNWGWSACFALLFALLFWGFGGTFISLLTNIESVQLLAASYLGWMVIYPMLAFSCFLLDGVYAGAAQGAVMRNTMLLATGGFFVLWWLTQAWGNHGLWFAFCGFALLRSVTLMVDWFYFWPRRQRA